MDSDEDIYIEDVGGHDTTELEGPVEVLEEVVNDATEHCNRTQTKTNEEENDDDGDHRVLRLPTLPDTTIDRKETNAAAPTNAINNRKRKTKEQVTTFNDGHHSNDKDDGNPVLLPDTSIELCTLRDIIQGYHNAMREDGKRKKYDGDFFLFRKTLDSFLTLPYVDDIPSSKSSQIVIRGYQAAQNTLTTMWSHLRGNAGGGRDDGNSIAETGQILRAEKDVVDGAINGSGESSESRSTLDADKTVRINSFPGVRQSLVNLNAEYHSHRGLEEEIRQYQVMLSETQQSLAGLITRNEELSKDRDRLLADNPERVASCLDESLKQELQQVKSMLKSSVIYRNSVEREVEDDEARTCISPETDSDLDSTGVDINRLMDEIKHESQLQSERQHRLLKELQIQKTRNEKVMRDREASWEIERRRMDQQIDEQTKRNERVLLERERIWESEVQRLQRQIDDQMEQIKEFNPTIQRNRILLEQERLKIEELEEDLEAANKKHALIEGEFEDYQRTADNMRKDLEKDIQDKEQLVAEAEEQLKELQELGKIHSQQNVADQLKLASIAAYDDDGKFSRLVAIKIPSDLEASGGTEFYGEHVTELDWELKDSSGKFTGWLNLEGNPDSHGILRMEGGSVYDGEWKLGEWNGTSQLAMIDGNRAAYCLGYLDSSFHSHCSICVLF